LLGSDGVAEGVGASKPLQEERFARMIARDGNEEYDIMN